MGITHLRDLPALRAEGAEVYSGEGEVALALTELTFRDLVCVAEGADEVAAFGVDG